MEFKMKVKISENMAKALGIDEDTAFETYFEKGEIVVHPLSEEEIRDSGPCGECPFDSKCPSSDEETDDIDIDSDCPVGVESCEECEYFCPHCGKCVLEE